MSNNITAECILKTSPDVGLENYSLITCLVNVPYYIWTEILTAKRFARNASSNRAMTVDKNISSLGYYKPETFYLNGLGMSSGETASIEAQIEASKIWESVWKYCEKASKKLSMLSIAKEQSSRVLPAFKMMRGLITGTKNAWDEFFKLRTAPDADSAMQLFANLAKKNIELKEFTYNVMHLPFISQEEIEENKMTSDEVIYIGAGRIARISYGDIKSKQNDYELGLRLKNNKHYSSFDHSAGWIKNPYPNTLCSKDKDKNIDINDEIWGWENVRASFEREEEV